MAVKRRALIICPEAPYPAAGGGANRTASLVEYLASNYSLDAIAFREPRAPDPAQSRLAELTGKLEVIELAHHRRDAASRAVRNVRRLWRGAPPLLDRFSGFDRRIEEFVAGTRYRLIVVEHFWCAGYADLLAPAADELVLDLHNIESVLHRACAAAEPWPLSSIHRRFESACRAAERALLPRFSSHLVTSPDDAARLEPLAPESRTVIYPNTVPLRPAPERREDHSIIFTGNLEYHPNANAIRYFRDEIWPDLRSRWPGLIWRVAGKNPHAASKALEKTAGVELKGPFDEPLTELASSKVAIVPLLAGSGTRVKILEAWAAATPVVSTTIGAEGLPATPGADILIADTPGEFVEAVSLLLTSNGTCRRIGEGGRRLFEREFTWNSAWRRLKAAGV